VPNSENPADKITPTIFERLCSMLIGLFMKFLYTSVAIDESITSQFLLTRFTTQALNAIGKRSILDPALTSGIKFPTSTKLANDRYLSFSSDTSGLIEELNVVKKSKFIFILENN